MINPTDVLKALCPNGSWILRGEELIWSEILDKNGTPTGEYNTPNLTWIEGVKPAKSEYEIEYQKQLSIYNSLEYQRRRRPEYPPLADLADAIYWQAEGDNTKMTAYLAAVEAVKQKYPKG
jgi:hypothetical protein